MLTFLSHSSEDKAFYTTFCLVLDAAGLERWDPKSMSVGESLAEQLQTAIRACEVCVLIATRRSVESPWCLAELGAFWGAGKKVLMFIADPDLADTTLPPQFKDTLCTDDASELIATLKNEKDEYLRRQASSDSKPSKEEDTIRLFYEGISDGLRGNDAGWKQAWDQCSESQQIGYRDFRPDVPRDATARTILKPLYQNSSIHEILHISEHERVSSSEAVYLVMYKERKEALLSQLHFKFFEDRDITIDQFYNEFSDPTAIYRSIVKDVGKYYDFHSSAESYKRLSQDELKDAIMEDLHELPVNRLFGGNLIFELGTYFHLKNKEQKKRYIASTQTPRICDIGYVLKIHLKIEKREWRITHFEHNSTIYVDALK